ncbi:MAG: hypothetical protein A2418_00770 [Candidatus Brennerbacteria bacterium RIFOXYC1_FULL_41_11]|uniref:Uncharacterized protein n=1 Tax=Candidatus Brennerbacteria bacterium RIFOXYD1_FULL_41_16 TaxID=1797529 RepID=A0A1G1XLK9_9BACT|nr:MAG: hypothetical protein A2483_00655 [Candidatus Peregrinibacteria bacterium RIFOXYC2_FULL_33_13]OGY39796.1 MAG: hypothetical protein A2391_03675 [Candidatus Brennerbacteria bacterium RIFOXYB1_FULL_41_13]OGY40413.1 MAG: hypothetical protein A2418_00770 [Candidatus Brennerbacteria bacterium RIFOXYC1_FULL_41_11]OGY40842.1 MAG: hypothetical protein A2570_00305 [Candidatus Brennerbacteria bacterium RIFOXYD1_FULL_41_16]
MLLQAKNEESGVQLIFSMNTIGEARLNIWFTKDSNRHSCKDTKFAALDKIGATQWLNNGQIKNWVKGEAGGIGVQLLEMIYKEASEEAMSIKT